MKKRLTVSLIFLFLPFLAPAQSDPTPDTMHVYFGTYTRGDSEGIYVSTIDMKTGQLSKPKLAGKCESPNFLAVHPSPPATKGKAPHRLFATHSVPGGAVSSWSVNEDGTLKKIAQAETGEGPCHLDLTADAKTLLVANYRDGSTASFRVKPNGDIAKRTALIKHEGSSAHPKRQTAPHAHGVYVNADNTRAYVPDLGIDKVLVFDLDDKKGLVARPDLDGHTDPGAGPRHFDFHPNGRFAYTNNELNGTIKAFDVDPKTGGLSSKQIIRTLDVDWEDGFSTAELHVHPSGKFLYCSNRGHNSISAFTIDPTKGTLSRIGVTPSGGTTPRGFGIDPTGTFLVTAHQKTHDVHVWRIDPRTGALRHTGHKSSVPMGVCVVFLPPNS